MIIFNKGLWSHVSNIRTNQSIFMRRNIIITRHVKTRGKHIFTTALHRTFFKTKKEAETFKTDTENNLESMITSRLGRALRTDEY